MTSSLFEPMLISSGGYVVIGEFLSYIFHITFIAYSSIDVYNFHEGNVFVTLIMQKFYTNIVKTMNFK